MERWNNCKPFLKPVGVSYLYVICERDHLYVKLQNVKKWKRNTKFL